ncbi:MAG TPA: CBS domain-containing protein [Dehalococcoidia bacterium]|jgi:CBS domain-containing protein|nr:CBS domain-containing protein [Dehalococcoidia bacterium]
MTKVIQEETQATVAGDIMTRPVVAASRTTTVRDLAIQMFLGGFSGMPITERDGSIVGLVTEFDVIRAIQGGLSASTTVAEAVMTRDVVTVDVDTPLMEVVEILERERFQRVPVTDRGKLVGVVSRPDVLRWLIEPNFMTFA